MPLYAGYMNRARAAWLLPMVVGLAVLAPSASAAQINPAVQLQALSCASIGNCSAVGGYDDGLGNSQALLVSESRGNWQHAVQAQPPAGAAADPFKVSQGGGLVDIACPAAGDCTAIGRYTDANRTDHGVLFTETRGHWARGVQITRPSNAVTSPRAKSGVVDVVGLASISCNSVGNCVAVGNYESNAEVWEPMLIVEHGGHWARAIEAPMPAKAPVEGQNAVLLSVTCSHSGTCTAAGEYIDSSGHQQGLLVTGGGSNWSAAPAPAPPTDADVDPNVIPSSVACASDGQCAAVGTYVNPLQNSLGLLLNESSGSWAGATGASLPANAAPASTVGDQTVVLASVACPQAVTCTAVGWYFDNYENGQGLLVSQAGGVWQPGAEVTLPSNAVGGLEKQSAGLDWISCASLGNCLATGVYTDIGYNSQGLLLSEVNGVWQTGVQSPLPPNASNVQYAAVNQADCTGVGACTVIGQYNDRRGDVLGYMLSETNGAWGHATELVLPSANATEARLSLAAILAPGRPMARLAEIRRSRHYTYEYQAVEAGTATTSWYASEGGKRVLIASGRVHVAAPGRDKLTLQLTHAGDLALARARHLRVIVVAQFTPSVRQRAQHGQASFTLR
jgi:hypothetical protein